MTSPTPAEATPETRPRLVSVPKAAKQLGLSNDYLYQLIKAGGIQAVQLPPARGRYEGKRGSLGWGLRIEQAEIDDFIARNRVEAT